MMIRLLKEYPVFWLLLAVVAIGYFFAEMVFKDSPQETIIDNTLTAVEPERPPVVSNGPISNLWGQPCTYCTADYGLAHLADGRLQLTVTVTYRQSPRHPSHKARATARQIEPGLWAANVVSNIPFEFGFDAHIDEVILYLEGMGSHPVSRMTPGGGQRRLR